MNLSKQVANQKIRLCFTTISSLASIYTASVFSQSTLRRRGRWTRNTGTWAHPHRSPWPISIYIYTQKIIQVDRSHPRVFFHVCQAMPTKRAQSPSQTASGHHHVGRQIFGAGLHRHHALSPGEGWEKCGCFFYQETSETPMFWR